MNAINGRTKIVGVFGDPVEHTLSPAMHNAAFSAMGLNYVYLPFRVNRSGLGKALKSLPAMGISGINITIPHKIDSLRYMHCLDRESKLIHAVNTVKVSGGRLYGFNTDARGFTDSLACDCGFDARGRTVLILGAGGSARAVAAGLALKGAAEIIIANRTEKRAMSIASDIKKLTGVRTKVVGIKKDVLENEAPGVEVLVNATPVGMRPGDHALAGKGFFKKASSLALVYDLVYNRKETELLKTAGSFGIRTANGLGMLLHQGAVSLEIWTGKKPPVGAMRNALMKAFLK